MFNVREINLKNELYSNHDQNCDEFLNSYVQSLCDLDSLWIVVRVREWNIGHKLCDNFRIHNIVNLALQKIVEGMSNIITQNWSLTTRSVKLFPPLFIVLLLCHNHQMSFRGIIECAIFQCSKIIQWKDH